MAKQEITLKGLDGHEDHLVYDAADGQISGSLEDCSRSLFPAEGESTPRLRFQGFEGEWVKAMLDENSPIKVAQYYTQLPPTKVRYGVLQCPLSAFTSNIIEVDAVFYFCLMSEYSSLYGYF